jgi:hypothetical protein
VLSSATTTRTMDKSTATRLISVHTPKAAGTSLRRILQQHFGAAYMDDNDDPADPLSKRNLDPCNYFGQKKRFPANISCVHGHMHPGRYVEGDYLLITFLRQPIENIISIYYFWRTLTPGPHGALFDYFINYNPSLVELARLPLLKNLFSHSYFGGFDMSRFTLIGRHEDRDSGLHRMQEMLDIDAPADLHDHRTPPSEERLEAENDPALRRKLGDILIDDIRFYEKWAR